MAGNCLGDNMASFYMNKAPTSVELERAGTQDDYEAQEKMLRKFFALR